MVLLELLPSSVFLCLILVCEFWAETFPFITRSSYTCWEEKHSEISTKNDSKLL